MKNLNLFKIRRIIKEEFNNLHTSQLPEFGDRLHNLNEIELTTKEPYKYKRSDINYDYVEYEFDSENYEYLAIFQLENRYKRIWSFQFGVSDGTPESITNEFKISNVMSTIINIILDFINKYKPNAIKIHPSDQRRYRLYTAAIKEVENDNPNYYPRYIGEYIVIERKVKIFDKNAIEL